MASSISTSTIQLNSSKQFSSNKPCGPSREDLLITTGELTFNFLLQKFSPDELVCYLIVPILQLHESKFLICVQATGFLYLSQYPTLFEGPVILELW